jgi:hypothetical protein
VGWSAVDVARWYGMRRGIVLSVILFTLIGIEVNVKRDLLRRSGSQGSRMRRRILLRAESKERVDIDNGAQP